MLFSVYSCKQGISIVNIRIQRKGFLPPISVPVTLSSQRAASLTSKIRLMNQNPSQQQSDAFSTMGDDLIESRFSQAFIKAFQDSVEDFDSLLPQRNHQIRIDFEGAFDVRTRQAILRLVEGVFAEAERYCLTLAHTDPRVRFHTPASWEKSIGQASRRVPTLPAARIHWGTGIPVVELIIPEKIATSEEVIKTVRLLFSKLFGKLFFDEHVPKKPAFRMVDDELSAMTFGRTEQIHFCRLMDRFPASIMKTFDQIARKRHFKGPKARELGKAAFFHQLLQEDIPTAPLLETTLNTVFMFLLDEFKTDFDGFFDRVADRLFALSAQSTLLLPYDQSRFAFLREDRQWMLFNALDERLQIVINAIHELTDCRAFLARADLSEPSDIQLSDLWCTRLGERIRLLKKKGLVKPFLIEGAVLTSKQQYEKTRFPLWLWQHCFPKDDGARRQPDRIIQHLTEQYRTSIYQKILELTIRLLKAVKALQKQPQSPIAESADYPLIKALFAWLEVRLPTLKDMHFTCSIGHHLSSIADRSGIGKKTALKNFETGWSYFISFALVHQYFLQIARKANGKEQRAQQFFDLIDRFVQKRIIEQPSFQIAGLLLELYRERRFDLAPITYLISQDAPILDFFVLHQSVLFNNPSTPPKEIIGRYAKSINHWQQQRDRQRIGDEERTPLTA
jgi:hypothetical protein